MTETMKGEVLETVPQAEREERKVQEGKPDRLVQGIVIKDPALGGWEIHRTFQKVQIKHPTRKSSTVDCKAGMQEALGLIFEHRVIDELQGAMSLQEFNTGVQRIQMELQMAAALPQPKVPVDKEEQKG